MKTITKMMTAIVATFFLAVPAWAAEEVSKSNGAKIIEGLLPLIIIVGLLLFLMRRSNRRAEPLRERAIKNMDTIEKQNERIIALLEEIAGRKRSPEQTPPPLPRGPAGRSEG